MFLSAILPPIGCVLTLDFFCHRHRYEPRVRPYRGVYFGPVIAVASGVVAGSFLKGHGISAVNGMVVTTLVYLLWHVTFYWKKA